MKRRWPAVRSHVSTVAIIDARRAALTRAASATLPPLQIMGIAPVMQVSTAAQADATIIGIAVPSAVQAVELDEERARIVWQKAPIPAAVPASGGIT